MDETLKDFLEQEYGLNIIRCDLVSGGLDSQAAVYRVASDDKAFLLKIRTGPFYEASCVIPRELHSKGIAAIAPVAAASGNLWLSFEGKTITLYPFIAGDAGWETITGRDWKEAGTIFRRIHETDLSALLFSSVRRETFDPSRYIRAIAAFDVAHHQKSSTSPAVQVFCAGWQENKSTIDLCVSHLETLLQSLREKSLRHVLTHADFHPANLLREESGRVWVIDWDEVMIAPKERDFIFVETLQADGFFEGYGPVDIDWQVLAYYLWERVAQDITAFAHDICQGNDWSEENRAHNARLFLSLFAEGGTASAGMRAMPRLQ